MNMPNRYTQDQDFEYQLDEGRGAKSKAPQHQSRRASYSRANRPAVSHNGIHRRRNKRFSW